MEAKQGHFTFALSSSKVEAEIKIFAADLTFNEYRVIQKGSIMLSIWLDQKLVICASNLFKTRNERGQSGFVIGADVNPIKPLISPEDCTKLATLSQGGLAAIARKMGHSGSW